jgi:predicted membrane channel-forming protein YqfA (hemolysin III family)
LKLFGRNYKTTKELKPALRHTIIAALAAACLLIVPLLAELLTDEMDWTVSDFIAAWMLLFISFFIYRLVSGRVQKFEYRAAAGLAVGTGLFLVWSNLAVGLIGNEDNPANWMYMGVLGIGFLGSIISRLQPRGMMRVLFAMTLAHLLITVIALIARLDLAPESSVIEIIGVNGFFAVLWSGSALLFRNASIEKPNV